MPETIEMTEEQKKVHDFLMRSLRACEDSTAETEYRTVSREDYKFYAGHQDDDEVLERLAELNRPATVYNEIRSKVDILIGLGAQSKYDAQVLPVGAEDEPLAEVMNATLLHFRKQMDMSRKEVDCFEHTVKGGRSMLYFWIDKSNPFDPKIMAKRIPGYMFWLDPNFMEYDLSDCRYVFIDKWFTEEEMKAQWPQYDISMAKDQGGEDYPIFWNEEQDLYRIVEGWYVSYVDAYWIVNPFTGQPEKLTKEELGKFYKALREGIPDPRNPSQLRQFTDEELPESIKSVMKQYNYAIFCASGIIEGDKSSYSHLEGYPFAFYGAYKDDELNNWFGAITAMKDPQRTKNVIKRQLVHMLQTMPKGLLIHEAGAILNIEEYEQNSSSPNYHMEVAKGMLDKVTFQEQPQIPNIYQSLSQELSQDIKDASGVQDPLLGIQTTSREPGVSVRMRQEMGMAVLHILYDNFAHSRHKGHKILMGLIQQYVTGTILIRMQGEKGKQLLRINSQRNPSMAGFNDITAGRFDLEMSEVTETATMRLAVAQMLNDFSHNNPGTIPPHLLLEYTNVPFSLKQELKGYWEAQQQREYELQKMELEAKIGAIRQRQNNKKEG